MIKCPPECPPTGQNVVKCHTAYDLCALVPLRTQLVALFFSPLPLRVHHWSHPLRPEYTLSSSGWQSMCSTWAKKDITSSRAALSCLTSSGHMVTVWHFFAFDGLECLSEFPKWCFCFMSYYVLSCVVVRAQEQTFKQDFFIARSVILTNWAEDSLRITCSSSNFLHLFLKWVVWKCKSKSK